MTADSIEKAALLATSAIFALKRLMSRLASSAVGT
jgi:hypothetical protein